MRLLEETPKWIIRLNPETFAVKLTFREHVGWARRGCGGTKTREAAGRNASWRLDGPPLVADVAGRPPGWPPPARLAGSDLGQNLIG